MTLDESVERMFNSAKSDPTLNCICFEPMVVEPGSRVCWERKRVDTRLSCRIQSWTVCFIIGDESTKHQKLISRKFRTKDDAMYVANKLIDKLGLKCDLSIIEVEK